MSRAEPPAHHAPLNRVRSRLRMRHLVFIEALARRQNIRQAAQDLFVTQPAASKLLTEIESIFETKLFERNAHGVTTTSEGEVLLHWALKALSDMDAAQVEIGALQSGRAGRVRVGVFPVVASSLVPDAIALLRNTGSQIEVCLHEGLEDTLMPMLQQGLLDCVVGRLTAQPALRAVTSEILFEEPTVVVSRPRHPLADSNAWSAEELNAYDWALPSSFAPLYGLVASGLAAFSANAPRVAVQTASIMTILGVVSQTNMLSAIPKGVAERFVKSGQLAILPLPLSTSLHPVCIITAADIPLNAATSAYLEAVRKAAACRSY
ncbi:LysR substrate-binding domain-containing protein [Pusillimonas noertemannii]|uniref:DNA-binding transcriptional LysR family regulator n=1 Tax=Pusillimonas noertemannii TaxID=305977 RepID=A0A2U1CPU9_9BURK|nr:LysR substrate-binding domain-containing protein [Pusillimonas noertemannii]NYT67244.1 LysR family transcriptional regulator [Pusillimonas noertemannii]PVY67917.1 DNA-binding transcriptional LysR family regulator [Pusillimonas noertemannii]TFL12561.1 LysR family transcriptional regulator [Pusillimonas noertemannii]